MSELRQALLAVSMHDDSRRCLMLLKAILDTPGLADRLFQVLRPEPSKDGVASQTEGGQRMTWETFYVICFLVGLLLSVISFLAGACTCTFRRDFTSTLEEPMLTRLVSTAAHGARAGHRISTSEPSRLFWPGLAGPDYLLTRYSNIWALLCSGPIDLSGLAGAAIVFWFLFRV